MTFGREPTKQQEKMLLFKRERERVTYVNDSLVMNKSMLFCSNSAIPHADKYS